MRLNGRYQINMNKLLISVLCSVFFMASCVNGLFKKKAPLESSNNRPVQVFIIAGQSNAVGYNNIVEYQKGQVEFPGKFLDQPQVLY